MNKEDWQDDNWLGKAEVLIQNPHHLPLCPAQITRTPIVYFSLEKKKENKRLRYKIE
jgi:hypothetical protein